MSNRRVVRTFAVGQWFERDNVRRAKTSGAGSGAGGTPFRASDTCVITDTLPGDRYKLARVDVVNFGADGAVDMRRCVIGRHTPVMWRGLADVRIYRPIPPPRRKQDGGTPTPPPDSSSEILAVLRAIDEKLGELLSIARTLSSAT